MQNTSAWIRHTDSVGGLCPSLASLLGQDGCVGGRGPGYSQTAVGRGKTQQFLML